jgi:hypothetical protein
MEGYSPMNPERPENQLDLGDSAGPRGRVQITNHFAFLRLIVMNITLLIGLCFFLLAVVLAARTHFWLAKAQFTEGEIVEMIKVRAKKGYTYKPRVRYTSMDGYVRDFVRSYSSSPPDFTVGEKVAVAYDPQSQEARIVTFGQRFGFAWVLAWIGFSLATLSVGFAIGRQIVPRIYLH